MLTTVCFNTDFISQGGRNSLSYQSRGIRRLWSIGFPNDGVQRLITEYLCVSTVTHLVRDAFNPQDPLLLFQSQQYSNASNGPRNKFIKLQITKYHGALPMWSRRCYNPSFQFSSDDKTRKITPHSVLASGNVPVNPTVSKQPRMESRRKSLFVTLLSRASVALSSKHRPNIEEAWRMNEQLVFLTAF